MRFKLQGGWEGFQGCLGNNLSFKQHKDDNIHFNPKSLEYGSRLYSRANVLRYVNVLGIMNKQ